MSLRKLGTVRNFEPLDDDEYRFPSLKEVEEWRSRNVRLAASPSGTVINILDPIFPGGFRARDMAEALRGATGDVIVNINSPGGLFGDGVAMHTMLEEHPGKVIVNVLGIAASAATLPAMAADEIRISTAGAMMIHNAQALVDGDWHTMQEALNRLKEHDDAIRRIYAKRTGQSEAKLATMMRPLTGTWMWGKDAVTNGFADSVLGEEAVVKNEETAQYKAKSGRATLESMLAEKGYTRRERRSLFREVFPDRLQEDDPPVDKGPSLVEIAAMIRNIGKT